MNRKKEKYKLKELTIAEFKKRAKELLDRKNKKTTTPRKKKKNTRVVYKQYIKSRKWAKKRDKIFAMYNYTCYDCVIEKAEHVHHLTYRHLGKERDDELIPLCKRCHEIRHGIADK